MSWSAFYQAMRNGISNRAGGTSTRRIAAGQQQQQRANAGRRPMTTQTQQAVTQQTIIRKPMDQWDQYIMDVSPARSLSDFGVVACLIRPSISHGGADFTISFGLQEFGEPWAVEFLL